MEYPYSTSTGSIIKILEKIQNVGQPSKVDKKWFSSIGFSKTSEQRMIAVLKFIGFAEADGSPTNLWTQYRSKLNGKKILGQAIKNAYQELFEIYPNANELGKDELTHFFSTRTTAGSLALSHTVNTFKNMAEFADFESVDIKEEKKPKSVLKQEEDDPQVETANDENGDSLVRKIQTKNGVTVNINIQLTETTDERVFDKFFESMKKHLLS